MKCDRCDNEATVQEITIRNGVRVEMHLCEQCARQAGLGPTPTAPPPLHEILQKYIQATGMGHATVVAAKTRANCPSCKLTWEEFRQADRLGCPDCYTAFEAQLGPLLERAHEGGIKHCGKTPARACAAPSRPERASPQNEALERMARVTSLRKQLEQAVASEQYERAAAIRDQIRQLSAGDGPTPSV